MARYTGPREKIERRLGARLSLKGERSLSPKSASVRRPYPPGVHGKGFQRKLSEFGSQLKSKQKIRNTYRMMEKQFKSSIKGAMKSKTETSAAIAKELETRLDNVVYRAGIAQSRDQARQVVNHGHILVNGRKVDIPSYKVKKNDEISVRGGSMKNNFFASLVPQWISKYAPPAWIELDKSSFNFKIKNIPEVADSGLDPNDIQSIIEFYSR